MSNSWDNLESKVETMLRTACKAATDSAALTVRYKCFWADSAAAAITFPAVILTASPAVNDGWRTDLYKVPVDLAVLTAPIDDTYGSVGKAIYAKVREGIEYATHSVTGWPNIAVTVEASEPPQTIDPGEDWPSGLRVIPLRLTAEVAINVRT